MTQTPKQKKRKLPKDIAQRPDREVMEKVFGKKVVKELDKLTEREPKTVENKGA